MFRNEKSRRALSKKSSDSNPFNFPGFSMYMGRGFSLTASSFYLIQHVEANKSGEMNSKIRRSRSSKPSGNYMYHLPNLSVTMHFVYMDLL
jgi:hypothetical protein